MLFKIFPISIFFLSLPFIIPNRTFWVYLVPTTAHPKLFQTGGCLHFCHLSSSIISPRSNLMIIIFKFISPTVLFILINFKPHQTAKIIQETPIYTPHLTLLSINFSTLALALLFSKVYWIFICFIYLCSYIYIALIYIYVYVLMLKHLRIITDIETLHP